MLNTINGIPAHVLLVHAVVVLVPLAALLAVLAVAWPAARRRLGIITPLAALLGLGFIPLATQAGEWLQEHVQNTALVRDHVELGEGLLPWAGLLFVFTAAVWLLENRTAHGRSVPALATAAWVRPAANALIVVVAVMSIVQVYRIGDSGAKAAWHNNVSATPISAGEAD